jgi:subtilisin family serine protease
MLKMSKQAKVINMSLQWVDNNNCQAKVNKETDYKVALINSILSRAIIKADLDKRDVLWVFAAGNECGDSKHASPASLTERFPENTLSVASVNLSNQLSNFSNRGEAVTVAAPGEDILSAYTKHKSIFLGLETKEQLMIEKSGTSMAAPIVSGLAGLVWSNHPNFKAVDVKKCILFSTKKADRVVSGQLFGLIDAEAAVKCDWKLSLPKK